MKFIVVETTFDKKEEAEKLAILLLEQRLTSCVQISEVDSIYTWKGKIEKDHEFLLTIKTTKHLYRQVEKTIRENHSYETPQIIALPIYAGSEKYLGWVKENTKR